MNNTEMIKELRALTSAGMKDCKDALEETGWDLQKAVDVIKTKGLNIADGRSGSAASEGVVLVCKYPRFTTMMEINCQTDFVANSPDFKNFAQLASEKLSIGFANGDGFHATDVETERKALVAITKENVVVRRWWVEEAVAPGTHVFSYVHSNNKIGVILTLQVIPNQKERSASELSRDSNFVSLGENMAMQVAAMNPLAIDVERLAPEDMARQQAIFEQQLTELKKPQAAWPKILEGKFRKWHTEVCLMEQESVWVPKHTVKQLVTNVGTAIGGEAKVITMIRCQVGEGVEVKKDNLAEEVAKMM